MEILSLCLGSGGIIGVLIIFFRTGRLVETVSRMDKKLDVIDAKLESMSKEIGNIRVEIRGLEVRLEERTLRVIHTQKTGTVNDPAT